MGGKTLLLYNMIDQTPGPTGVWVLSHNAALGRPRLNGACLVILNGPKSGPHGCSDRFPSLCTSPLAIRRPPPILRGPPPSPWPGPRQPHRARIPAAVRQHRRLPLVRRRLHPAQTLPPASPLSQRSVDASNTSGNKKEAQNSPMFSVTSWNGQYQGVDHYLHYLFKCGEVFLYSVPNHSRTLILYEEFGVSCLTPPQLHISPPGQFKVNIDPSSTSL